VPLILGSVALQAGTVISRFLAAHFPSGSISVLDYASRISIGIMEFLTSGVMLVTLADWSKDAARDNDLDLLIKLRNAIRILLIIVSPITIMVIVLRDPIIRIVLQRGNFDPGLALLTASIMSIYIFVIPIDTIGRLYVRLFLVWKSTQVIGLGAVIRVFSTLIFSVILMNILGIQLYEAQSFSEFFSRFILIP
jgi:putative peptidoglycan lipid II flippase